MTDTLDRLREYLPSSYEELAKDWGRQKIVERALQISDRSHDRHR
jgi:hypothetical protein